MLAELVIEKTNALGWQLKNSLENYNTEIKKDFSRLIIRLLDY